MILAAYFNILPKFRLFPFILFRARVIRTLSGMRQGQKGELSRLPLFPAHRDPSRFQRRARLAGKIPDFLSFPHRFRE